MGVPASAWNGELVQHVCFLVPGTTAQFRCGGLSVELQTARLVGEITKSEVVTYKQKQGDLPFLDDLLLNNDYQDVLWIVSWGFDVPRLIKKLNGRLVAYHAHSSGYGFNLPAGIPVLAVSRNTLGYWGSHAARNPLFLVPNALHQEWLERGDRFQSPKNHQHNERSIDVLVQERKSSPYVLRQLVPELRKQGLSVTVQTGWVDDLVGLFNDAKVYVYDSADYWRGRGVSEGFGLPPLEAMACGCVVFSSFNHALADTLDPGFVGHQIGCGTLVHDVQRIMSALQAPSNWLLPPQQLEVLLNQYSETALKIRWRDVLKMLESLEFHEEQLIARPLWQIRTSSFFLRSRNSLRQKIERKG